MKTTRIKFLFLVMMSLGVSAQDAIVPLWPNAVPNQKTDTNEKEQVEYRESGIIWITNVQKPTLEVYLPAKGNANGKAVLIFPGGGYSGLAYDWEGRDIAKALNGNGVAGIVVKYRLPRSKSIVADQQIVPLQDAQRAIRMVRSKAEEWNLAKNEIGIMGFSAGGHVASTLGTHFGDIVYPAQDAIDGISARPDFMALIYPVITLMEPAVNMGSRESLVGKEPTMEQLNYLSNEKQVKANTPPTFLLHAVDDNPVPVENSLMFFEALKAHDISTTMHIYPSGGHGFSLAHKDKRLKNWLDLFVAWLDNLD
nr:alpha/beta hydrolase [Allomuricauda sp.]